MKRGDFVEVTGGPERSRGEILMVLTEPDAASDLVYLLRWLTPKGRFSLFETMCIFAANVSPLDYSYAQVWHEALAKIGLYLRYGLEYEVQAP